MYEVTRTISTVCADSYGKSCYCKRQDPALGETSVIYTIFTDKSGHYITPETIEAASPNTGVYIEKVLEENDPEII